MMDTGFYSTQRTQLP